jgi:predicted nucleotidyltransferase
MKVNGFTFGCQHMERDHVLATLREHESELKAGGASALYLFGSIAKGTGRPDSDVDLFMDYADARFSLIDQLRLEHRINELLGRKVGLMIRGSLHPALKPTIEATALRVF